MTPMCLLEAIRQGDVKITDFSVLILDECHQTRANNDFKALMDVYMDAKFAPASTGSPRSLLPQVSSYVIMHVHHCMAVTTAARQLISYASAVSRPLQWIFKNAL